MDISKLKELPYDELRALYKQHLHTLKISKATINTAFVDTFYLWRKNSKTLFWDTVLSNDFENEARSRLLITLSEHSSGNVNALVSSYLSHLRKFRWYIKSDSAWERQEANQVKTEKIQIYVEQKKIFSFLLQRLSKLNFTLQSGMDLKIIVYKRMLSINCFWNCVQIIQIF